MAPTEDAQAVVAELQDIEEELSGWNVLTIPAIYDFGNNLVSLNMALWQSWFEPVHADLSGIGQALSGYLPTIAEALTNGPDRFFTLDVGIWQEVQPAIHPVRRFFEDADKLLLGDPSKLMDNFWKSFWKSAQSPISGILRTPGQAAAAPQLAGLSGLPRLGAYGGSGAAFLAAPLLPHVGGAAPAGGYPEALPGEPAPRAPSEPAPGQETWGHLWADPESFIEEGLTRLGTFVGENWGSLQLQAFKFALPAAEAVSKALGPKLASMATKPFADLRAKLQAFDPLDESHTLNNRISELFATATAAGLEAHQLSLISSLKLYGFGLDCGPVAAFLADVGDFGRIISPYIDAYCDVLVGIPAKREALEKHRPTRPDPMMLRDLYGSAHIDAKTFKDELAKYGYSDSWCETIRAGNFKNPNHRELLIMAESGLVDDAWLFGKLREVGYKDGDSARMLVGLRDRALAPHRGRFLAQVNSLRSDGYISESTYQQQLGFLQLAPDAQEIQDGATNIALMHAGITKLLSILGDAFDREMISLDLYKTALQGLGLTAPRPVISYWPPRPREAPWTRLDPLRFMVETVGREIRQYRKIYLTRPQDQQPAFDAAVKAAVPKYIQAYEQGDMTTSDLNQLLILAGMLPEVADLTVLLAQNKRSLNYSVEAKKAGIPDAREQYIMGFMTDADYEKYLCGNGLLRGAVEVEMAIAQAKRDARIGAQVKATIVPAYEAGYVKGFIGLEELISAYDTAGLDARAQNIRLALLEAKSNAAKGQPLGQDYIMAWVRAAADYIVTTDDFVTALQASYLLPTQREKALALVPVYRKSEKGTPFDAGDLQALLDAVRLGLLSANYVPDWVTERKQREKFAREVLDWSADRKEKAIWPGAAPPPGEAPA